ncbi:nuclease-related domain-containing DEAD/DEAH box helicase [Oribacterium sp. FC2011]|uniref:nuclease-related domain-containing DEAD/DEAH box helicase n=1 Tax=Oribacterium sp. FC2011 TaxID=1408311 RepID=UPI0004E0FFCE|nr:NERD domain-containing protein [Oribacterium sp. FC2011]
MARMIPAQIERNDPRRTGEYMVYDWLANDNIPGVAFYSHTQNSHDHKTMSEVDFLYICTSGLLCIEVKGGQVKKEDSIWMSVNKRGETFKIQDPFFQTHGCMKAASSFLENTYGKKSIESFFCVGCAVVFPECIAECNGDGVIKDVMFDGRNDLSKFNDFLINSLKYWSDELYQKQRKRTTQLSQDQIDQIVTLFEGDFCSVPSMKLQIDTSYSEMLKLTDEQFDVFHSIEENKRVLVFGSAGTGKSILAAEKLRLNISKKRSVAYICFNKNMASYVEQNVKCPKNSFVGTYHSLLGQYISESYTLSTDELSCIFLEKKVSPKNKYDLIIIDEAQDLLSINMLECINSFSQQGMANSEWIIFADPNQDIFQKGKRLENTINEIRNKYNPCILRLYKNCRNTAPIVRRTSMLTSIPPTKYLKLTGPDVKAFEFKDNNDAIFIIDKEIKSLLSGGTFVRDIMILSTKKKENSILKSTNMMANIPLVEVKSFKGLKNNQINYMTVQSFKGLESKVVFYIDIDGFDSIDNRRINYVAMTRAQILLYYFYNYNQKDEYNKRVIEGIKVLEV